MPNFGMIRNNAHRSLALAERDFFECTGGPTAWLSGSGGTGETLII